MDTLTAESRLFRRQVLQLSLVAAVVIAGFFATRAFAASNRAMTLKDAAEWYRRGDHELAAGRLPAAIDAFRRASSRDRTQRQYALALARALARNGNTEAARGVLVGLRDAAPEDRDVNLELARLSAAAGDLRAAVGYYHNALYAPWPLDADDARRRVRAELIRLLIARQDIGRAQAELMVLTSDLPDDAAHHIDVARLFDDTDDYGHALEQYRRALRLDPNNREALAGAGQAAFSVGDYRSSQGYLRRVSAGAPDVSHTRALVDVLLASDPWAARIGSAERRRRLQAVFSDVASRLKSCADERAGSSAPIDPALLAEADAFGRSLQSQRAIEQDTIEAAFDLIGRMERDALRGCGDPTILDQALALIARQHGAEPK